MSKEIFRWLGAVLIAIVVITVAHCVEQEEENGKLQNVQTAAAQEETEATSAASVAESLPTATWSPVKKIKKFRTDLVMHPKNGTATVIWKAVGRADRYKVAVYKTTRNGGVTKKASMCKWIRAGKKMAYTFSFDYGKRYLYCVSVYQRQTRGNEVRERKIGVAGKYMIAKSARLFLIRQKDKGNHTYATLRFIYRDQQICPDGIEIYRGNSMDRMKKCADVNWKDLETTEGKAWERKYTDRTTAYRANYYQIRSYVTVRGKKYYGQKTQCCAYLAAGYRGETTGYAVVHEKKKKIRKLEFVFKNTSKNVVQISRDFTHQSQKSCREGKKARGIFLRCDRAFCDSYGQDNREMGLDRIQYKWGKEETYRDLKGHETVSWKPGQTLYLSFLRHNQKKFRNPYFEEGHEDELTAEIFLFHYLGKESYLDLFGHDHVYQKKITWSARVVWHEISAHFPDELTGEV